MATTQGTMAAFVEAVGLTMVAEPIAARSDGAGDAWSREASHWRCTFSRAGHGPMIVEFSQGPAHRRWKKGAARLARNRGGLIASEFADIRDGERVQPRYLTRTIHHDELRSDLTEPTPPELADVLDCLASDAASYDNPKDFSDWCSEFGMDSDSIKAKKSYDQTGEQSKRLRHLLGSENYDRLLFQTERL